MLCKTARDGYDACTSTHTQRMNVSALHAASSLTPSAPLVYAMAAHVGLCAFLYGLLTIARAPAVWGIGRSADGTNPWAKLEPRISANLSNQFEWPLLFYAACLILLFADIALPLHIVLAWVFVVGRFIHSIVQIMTNNVRLRGIVFTINFLAVIGMWFTLVQHFHSATFVDSSLPL